MIPNWNVPWTGTGNCHNSSSIYQFTQLFTLIWVAFYTRVKGMHFEEHRYIYIQVVQNNPRFISSNQGKYASQCIAFSFFQFKIEIVWETFEYIWWRHRSDEIQTRKIYQEMKKVRTISFHRFCFCFQFKKREKRFFGNIFCTLKKDQRGNREIFSSEIFIFQ